MSQEKKRLLRYHEIAAEIGTSTQNVQLLVSRHNLPVIRIGRNVYIEKSVWEEFLGEHRTERKVDGNGN